MEFLSYYRERQLGRELMGDVQLTKALGLLKAFTFVAEDKTHGLDMHQFVTRKWLAKKGTMDQFEEQVLLAVSHAYPFGNFENWTKCRNYLPHVYAVLRLEEGVVDRGTSD